MRNRILAAVVSLLALAGLATLAAPAHAAPAASAAAPATIKVQPGQVAFLGGGGAVKVGRYRAHTSEKAKRSIFGERTTQACDATRSFNGVDHTLRQINGNVVVRAAWTHDTRGADRDVSYIDWDYNWPGTGMGEGTGISFENLTNYVLSVYLADYRNAVSGTLAEIDFSAFSYPTANTASAKKVHVWGQTDGATSGNVYAHSYWDNAPRMRLWFFATNWEAAGTRDYCDAYVPGQPST
jgi:hypothetical protein